MEKTLFLQLFCVAKHTTKRSGGPFLVTQAKSQSSCSTDNRYRGESDRPVIEFPSCLVNDKLFEDIHHRRMIGIF